MKFKNQTWEVRDLQVQNEWQTSFALIPHQMHNGTWIWLEKFEWRLKRGLNQRPFWIKREVGDNYNSPFEPRIRPPAPTPTLI